VFRPGVGPRHHPEETAVPFRIATEPGRPDHPNEDFAAVGARCAVVLDGVTSPPDADDGCSHGVAWYTRELGPRLLAGMEAGVPPRAALAGAIEAASAAHAHSCDLTVQDTPSATVVAVRVDGTELEYLVLSDSVLLVRDGERTTVVADTRLDALRGTVTGPVRRYRNVPGGFWTAGADPRAADEAITGTLRADACAALTDGAGRAVEVFGALEWGQALDLVLEHGPRALVDLVRGLEDADSGQVRFPRGKDRDDATVVSWTPGSGQAQKPYSALP
jgi:hypothetical protein